MNHQQPSPQSSFLSRALHASMEAAWRPKRRFLLHANRVSNVLTSVPIHGGDQSDTGGSDEQVRFCQQLGLAPPCLAPYAGQHCSCDRFVIDADHLHTCQQHSGNWYAAHERLLTVVDEIVRAAGFRTKRRYVATSRGSRRGDLEIRDANVADKAHLIIDVAMVHEFTAPATTSVATERFGMLRTPIECSSTLPNARCRTTVRLREMGTA